MAADENNIESSTEHTTMTPSTIETIDYSIYEWINKELDIRTMTNKGFQKVPVKWTAGERSWQVKKDSNLRDKDGTLILPAISIERIAVRKDLNKKGSIWADLPPIDDKKGGTIIISRKVKQDKTSDHTNAYSKKKTGQINFKTKRKNKTVYETLTVPLPVYIEAEYKISIKTEYQQQMNEIVQPFVTRTRGNNMQRVSYNDHTYTAFIDDDYTSNNTTSNMTSDERVFVTEISIRVLGHLIGDGVNQNTPIITKRESVVEVKIPSERIILEEDL